MFEHEGCLEENCACRMTIEEWVSLGVSLGYITQPMCALHDGMPLSDTEVELHETKDFDDVPCVFFVRLGTPEQWEQDAKAFKIFTEGM